MSDSQLVTPRVFLDDAPAPSVVTRIAALGAFDLTIDTVLADLGLGVQSSFLGHPRTPTVAAHLIRAPAGEHRVLSTELSAGMLAGSTARARCLLEHLDRLRDALAEASGAHVRVEISDAALDRAAR
jgi:hypothetical protein